MPMVRLSRQVELQEHELKGHKSMLRITRDHHGTSTLTTADGSLVYAFITPLPNKPGLTYAKPSPIPNVYCMFATLDGDGHFNPLEDKDLPAGIDIDAAPPSDLFLPGVDMSGENLPLFLMALTATIDKTLSEKHRVSPANGYDMHLLEFDFPFATAWAYAFTTMVDMLKLPDHGHGHVVSVVGGRTMLVHAVRPDNTADDILALAAATEQYYPMQVAKISPEVFWVKGKEWRSLTPKEGRGIFLPEDFPVKRDANGAPLTSGGGAGTRA